MKIASLILVSGLLAAGCGRSSQSRSMIQNR